MGKIPKLFILWLLYLVFICVDYITSSSPSYHVLVDSCYLLVTMNLWTYGNEDQEKQRGDEVICMTRANLFPAQALPKQVAGTRERVKMWFPNCDAQAGVGHDQVGRSLEGSPKFLRSKRRAEVTQHNSNFPRQKIKLTKLLIPLTL